MNSYQNSLLAKKLQFIAKVLFDKRRTTVFTIPLILIVIFFTIAPPSYAVPMVEIHSSNVGIDTISVSIFGTDIFIEENWDNSGPGFLEISGLEPDTNYTVNKLIVNSTGEDWTSFAVELLDPEGNSNDFINDVLPYPAFVPTGFTTSNDSDGLSFAQGFGIPRTSGTFPNLNVDVSTDVRDFLDFFGATLSTGELDFLSFGLRAGSSASSANNNQPFLLSQRPNAFSSTPIPEPSTYLLMAFGVFSTLYLKRRKNR